MRNSKTIEVNNKIGDILHSMTTEYRPRGPRTTKTQRSSIICNEP